MSERMFNDRVKLAEWARSQGIHPQTRYRWFRECKIPVPARRLPTGTIVVDAPTVQVCTGAALYAPNLGRELW